MSFSISNFRGGALNNSGARPNLFDVQLTKAPAVIGLVDTEFRFACKAAQIPPMTVGVVEVPYFGRVVKVPGNKTFDNWNVTIINDEGFEVRNAMEKWMVLMGGHASNKSAIGASGTGGLNDSLYGTGVVRQYPKSGATAIQTYEFTNIFPVNVSEIALDWSSNDAIEEFTVEFAYDYWTSVKGSSAVVT
jgi:hypothetical protein